jgi:molybdopterin-containing oxidoreductase family membrane subunit
VTGAGDVMDRTTAYHVPGGAGYWLAVAALAVLGIAGVGALVWKAITPSSTLATWGYPAATLALLLSTALSAPPLAFATRLARGAWSVPLRRAADLLALAGVPAAVLGIVLVFQLPAWRGRPSIWLDWPGAPQAYDVVALVLLAFAGIALLYVAALPDLAVLRDRGHSRLVRRLALGWTGSVRQWRVLHRGLILLGSCYALVLVFVHLIVIGDFALSLVPGWSSADMPPYHAVSGVEGGIAITLVVAALLRRQRAANVPAAAFHGASKLLLALALLWFYFFWAEFLTYWYGRTPAEQDLLTLLEFGPYRWAFYAAFGLCFVAPLLILIWNAVRKSAGGVTLAAALVLLGLIADRIRLYVAAWSVAGPVRERLETIPATHLPGVADLLILAGFPALAALLCLLALRFVPALALWELAGEQVLRDERPFASTRVAVLAKPT